MSTPSLEVVQELARLREMFQQAPNPKALLRGPDHRYEMANPAYLALVGHRDVVGKTVAEALPEVVSQGFIALLDEVFRSGKAFVGRETPVLLQNPTDHTPDPRVLDFVYQPMRDADGDVTGIFVDVTDVTERVRAQRQLAQQQHAHEQTLRNQQEMVALAMRGGRMGAWARDMAVDRVEWTADLEALFGLPEGSFGGTEEAFLQLVHPADRVLVQQAVGRAIATRSDYEVEFRFRHASGEWRWMEGRGRAVFDVSGRPIRLHGIGIDITERKRSDLRLAQLIEAAPVGIAISEPSGVVISTNDALLAILGYTREELRSEPLDWQRFTPPELLHLDLHHMEELRAGRSPPPFEKAFIRRDGSRASVLIVARFLPGEGERMVAFALDVSENRKAEEALRRTELRLGRLFETNLLGVLYFDLQGQVQDANDEFLRIVGYDRQELENGHIDWSRMTPEEFRSQDARAVAELRRTGAHAAIEKQYVRKDGTRIWVLVGSAMLEGENGVGFVLDLSGAKAAEGALRDADRRKDEFLATLAHELRNPLAPILSAVQLLGLLPAADPQLRRIGGIIERQVRHMVRLVDDLLDVSRITLGQINLRLGEISIGTVLLEALEAVRPSLEAAGHELSLALPSEELKVTGDATRLSQVFQNILNNAIKYTPAGGVVSLEAARCGERVRVSIRDNGVGIPREMQVRVFELFTRAHPDEELKTSGLGIGLALTRQLVELHGGTVTVHSDGVGRGSEFVVELRLQGG